MKAIGSALPAALLCTSLTAFPAPTFADNGFKGELKAQSQYMAIPADSLSRNLGVGSHLDNALNLRLMDARQIGSGWSWDMAWVLDLRDGASVELERRLYAYDPALYVSPARRNWWDLRHTFTNTGEKYAAQYIDRLNLSYTGEHAVLRVGRQTLTWGGGLIFHPMDLFNPFPPNATDTEYKPGADMIYAQWLFDSGADIQGVIAPRRDPATRRLEADQSAAGLKWHGFLGDEQQFGYQLLLAKNYAAEVFGAELTGSLGGATWTAEAVPTRLTNGSWRTSWLANLQYAWACFARNCSGYVEYFRNGFGVAGSGTTLAEIPAPLSERLARGELFTISRDYLAFGITMAWTPLLNIKPLLIANMNDGSKLLLVQAVRSLSDDVDLTLSAQSGFGSQGTEYGGLETGNGSATYLIPQRSLSARLDWYF